MNRETHLIRKTLVILLATALALTSCQAASSTDQASTVKVSSVTITPTVETSGSLSADQLIQLTWGTSGIISKVNVKSGAMVKKDDILAELQADSVAYDMISAQADLATAQRSLDDLVNGKLTLAQAQQNVVDARIKVEEAENTYISLTYPRASDTLIKNQQAVVWDAQHQMIILYNKYKDLIHHPDGDPAKTAALLAYTNAKLNLDKQVALLNWYTGKPTQDDLDVAKTNLDVARASLEDARRQRDIVKTGADPLAIDAAKAHVASAQAQVNSMYAIAPFDGEILTVQAVAGNSVSKGDNSVALVNRNTLKVDTSVDETSISGIKIGDKAVISMDSLPNLKMTGRVTMINPIGSLNNGLVKYIVTVSIDPVEQNLIFGGTANVVITTGEATKLLAVPINAIFSDSKGEYLEAVRADGNTERVDITSGDLSGSLVTFTTSGTLAEGDQVMLGGTTSTTTSGSSGNPGGGGMRFLGGPGGG